MRIGSPGERVMLCALKTSTFRAALARESSKCTGGYAVRRRGMQVVTETAYSTGCYEKCPSGRK